MAEDIRQHFGTDTAVTIALNSLADGADVVSSVIDFGNPGPFEASLEAKLNGASAAATGRCDIYAQFSNDNTDFSDSDNDLFVASVQMNGTAGVVKSGIIVPVDARYGRLRVANGAGAALGSSGNTLGFVPKSVDQV